MRMGRFYFPKMDTTSYDFSTFRSILDSGTDFSDLVDSFFSWRRALYVQACCDLLHLNMEDELRLQCQVIEDGAAQQDSQPLRQALLVRENTSLGYVLGIVEALGMWPAKASVLPEGALHVLAGSDTLPHAEMNRVMIASQGASYHVVSHLEMQMAALCPYSQAMQVSAGGDEVCRRDLVVIAALDQDEDGQPFPR